MGLTFTAVLKFTGVPLYGNAGLLGQIRRPGFMIGAGVMELLLAVGVLSSRWREASICAFVALCGLGVVFSAVVASGAPPSHCGCFGSWQVPIGSHYAMLGGLLLLARVIVCSPRRSAA